MVKSIKSRRLLASGYTCWTDPGLQDREYYTLAPGLVTGARSDGHRTIHVEDAQQLDEMNIQTASPPETPSRHRTVLVNAFIAARGNAIGAIVVRRNEVRPFSQKQIALIRIFADQAAIAIRSENVTC